MAKSEEREQKIVASDPGLAQGERGDGWGFEDSGFDVDGKIVLFRGNRYPIAGKKIPHLIPWASKKLGVSLKLRPEFESRYSELPPAPLASEALLNELAELSCEWTVDSAIRRRHTHGHALQDVYAARFDAQCPCVDAVLYPDSTEQVQQLVDLAKVHGWKLVPFGGGTNVSHALMRPKSSIEQTVLSVDMRKMNRILNIDDSNGIVHVEAGILGRDLQEKLARRGYTMGHEPDSIEFSTLGGWIATRSSGMKKNRYGNIEDILLDCSMITPSGTVESNYAPRDSLGVDPRAIALGSEGNFGIICSAHIKLFPLPKAQIFDSILFPDFETGLAFMRELAKNPPYPASARLMDNFQFQFGQALKPESDLFGKLKSFAQKQMVTRVMGLDTEEMVACTLLYEGSENDVAHQMRRVSRLANSFGGINAGPENGERGYQLTFAIAYIRDFLMRFGVMAESFETSVSWSHLHSMCTAVKACVEEEHARLNLSGTPIVSWRVTQLYHSGAAVYFYLASSVHDGPSGVKAFTELEHAARDAILKHGGSLSHHHGIGKHRAPFLPQVQSPTSMNWVRGAKHALDGDDVFAIHNGVFADSILTEENSEPSES